MNASLEPYPAYKDSGVAWLGEVPEGWEVRRLRDSIEACINGIWGSEPNGREDLPCVRVADFDRRRLRVRLAKPTMRAIAPNERRRRMLEKGDLLLEKSGGGDMQPVGVVILYDHEVPAVCSNFIARMPVAAGFNPGYLTYLHAHLYAIRLNVRSVKQTTGIQNLDSSAYLSEPIVFPPLPEQAAIVRFLDYMDRRIRRYSRAKQKLIKLLEEQKQAIIHRAVTGQIDVRTGQPYPFCKPSDLEWLGDVPEHWRIARLKDAAVVQTGLTLGKNYGETVTESYPYLRVANVQHNRLDLAHIKHINVPDGEAANTTLRSGDVLMTEGGDIDKLGRGCVWRNEIPGCLHQNHIFAVRCRRDVLIPEFLVGLMTSMHGRAYFQLTAKQTTNLACTNSTTLRAFPALLPPIVEQSMILDDVTRRTSGVEAAIARTEREIALFREYRTRLIADVVTGKLDVREAAARLPDEVEEEDHYQDHDPEDQHDDQEDEDQQQEDIEEDEA